MNQALATAGATPRQARLPWVRFLQVFIVVIPFLHALGIGAWLPLPMLVAGCALIAALATGGARWIWFERSDLWLVAMLACGCVPLLVFMDYAGQKNLNHFFAFTVTLALFYVFMRAWIAESGITIEQVSNAATIGLAIAAGAVVFEFALVNTFGVYLSAFLPYSADQMPEARVLEDLLRPRGLAAEPGFSAMVFEALVPLSLPTLMKHRTLLFTVGPLALAGFLLLFSAGAICSLIVASALMIAAGRGLGLKVLLFVLVLTGLALFFAGGELLTWLFDQVVGRKITDLMEGDGVQDIAGRYVAYRVAWESSIAHPFGIGWGMISQIFSSGVQVPDVPEIQSRGLLSLYLEVLVAAGVPGVLCLLIFLVRQIIKLARLDDPTRLPILFGLLALAIHHMFVLEFWFPMLWFYLALSAVWTRRAASQQPLR